MADLGNLDVLRSLCHVLRCTGHYSPMGFSTSQAVAIVGGIIVAAEVIWFTSIP